MISAKAVDLANAIKQVDRVRETRVNIPVLECIKVLPDPTNNGAWIIATDLDIEARAFVKAECEAGDEFLLPPEAIRFLSRQKSGDVSIGILDDGQLNITAARTSATLATVSADDFPAMPETDDLQVIEDAGELLDCMAICAPFVSKEETRYYLNGVSLHIGDESLNIVATDGHALRLCRTEQYNHIEGLDKSIIVPSKTVDIITKNFTGDVSILFNHSRILAQSETLIVISKLIDGTFPDYNRVIPKASGKQIHVSKSGLIDACDSVVSLAPKGKDSPSISFNPSDGVCALKLATNNAITSEINAVSHDDPGEIKIAGDIISKSCASVAGEQSGVILDYAGNKAPVLITAASDPEGTKGLAVAMPRNR